MNALQQFKSQPRLLFVSGIFFILISILWQNFPLFIFVAFVPLFALLDFSWAPVKLYLLALVALAGSLSEVILFWADLNTPILLYVFLITGLFSFYAIVQHFTNNKLNKFALLVLFIAMEYLLLKVTIRTGPVFLADILNHRSDWSRWNNATGYLGVSIWIMSTNLIFYQALIKSKKVNVLLFFLGVLCIVLPILYSLNLDYNAVTKEEMINLYNGNPLKSHSTYTLHGELLSRTGAWVSILIIIFTLVRIKTKKWHVK
jgi:apolipoprotein N-acyltransferase